MWMSKACIVQNPFGKHGKQVMMHYLSRSDWNRSVQVKASHYIVALFLTLQTFQASDKCGDRILGHFYLIKHSTIADVLCPCVWQCMTEGCLSHFTCRQTRWGNLSSGKCCLFLAHLAVQGDFPSKRETLGRLLGSSWWCSDGDLERFMQSRGAALCLMLKIQTSHQAQIAHPAASPSLICLKQSHLQKVQGKEEESLIWSQSRSH